MRKERVADGSLRDLVNALDPELFKACFTSWVETLRDDDPDIIAMLRNHWLPDVTKAVKAKYGSDSLDGVTVAVLDEVLRYPGLPSKLRHIDLEASRLPVLPTHFRLGNIDLRMFSMMTTFGTPQDVTADDLRVESFFPADEASAGLLKMLAGTSAL